MYRDFAIGKTLIIIVLGLKLRIFEKILGSVVFRVIRIIRKTNREHASTCRKL